MEESSSPDISDLYPVLAGLDLQGRKKQDQGVSWEDQFYVGRYHQRKKRKKLQKRDFFDVMIEANFSDKQINQLLLV